ncbi:unnamed protein product, partial [Symbiodinium necroappetens]
VSKRRLEQCAGPLQGAWSSGPHGTVHLRPRPGPGLFGHPEQMSGGCFHAERNAATMLGRE